MKLYQKIKVENFELMQRELQIFVKDQFPDPNKLGYYKPTKHKVSDACPNFYNYIIKNSKADLRLFTFYHSPPTGGLGKHIDGSDYFRIPIGLIFPVLNCTGTLLKWWDESNAKIINGQFGSDTGSTPANVAGILNPNDLVCIDQVEIDVPTFIRTDVIHSVENYNNCPRISLSIRWAYNLAAGIEFEEVMNFEPYNKTG